MNTKDGTITLGTLFLDLINYFNTDEVMPKESDENLKLKV